jgi:hypothetical protein
MSKLLDQVSVANIYVQPIHFCLSISLNTLSIFIFSSRALRPSACTHYFLAFAVFSIIFTFLMCPTEILSAFNLDWRNTPLGCKIRYHILYVPLILCAMMLVLAAFDRYCASSNSLRLRSMSTVRRARLNIVISTILMCIYMLPVLFIYYWNESTRQCQAHSGIPAITFLISELFLDYFLMPIWMIIFGFLTIYNIRQSAIRARRQRIGVAGRRTEGQLARTLILQIGCFLILTLPFGVTFCMNSFVPSTLTPMTLAIRNILLMWLQCFCFVSVFLHVTSVKAYRDQLILLLKRMRCWNAKVHPNAPRIIGIQHRAGNGPIQNINGAG